MSQAAPAKVATAPPRRSEPARPDSRVHDFGATRRGGLSISRPGDAEEVAADRLARQAFAANPRPDAPPPARASGRPAPAASTRGEGRELPAAQRDFFAPRFGHRFEDVRVHAGPAAAAAAASVNARAFTLGRDIYFGDGQYRPQSAAGRELLAHELAHTLQDRPDVIARRALDTTFDMPESDPGAAPGADSGGHADELATLVSAGPSRGNQPARELLGRVEPNAQPDAIASLRTRLPAADREKVSALAGASPGAAPPAAASNHPPEIRPGETAPAPVETREAPGEQPAPVHERASGAAAARMQEAVRSVGAEAPVEGGATPPPGSLDASAAAGGGGKGGAPASRAAGAAQAVTPQHSAQMAELQGVASLQVLFGEAPGGPPGDPETIARMAASQSLASRFASGAAEKSQTVLSAALAVPAQVMTSLGAARQAIAAQATTQGAALKQGAGTARKQVSGQASRVRGAIGARHKTADGDVEHDVKDARDRATRAHDDAAKGLGTRADTEKSRIRRSYDSARDPLIGVGIEAGWKANDAAAARAKNLLGQKNGESSVLDGPIHDDRLEANADASEKVGTEYANSFRGSAREQANKLPESRPEIVGKVDDVTKQARDGFSNQFTQITQGADALETGAKARSRQSATQMQSALNANASQSEKALDAAEAQQGTGLQGQADAAQAALDQFVAGTLTTFGGGIVQAARQLVASIRGFVGSAAAIPAPETDELSEALSESDPGTALTAMGAQVATVAPTMAGMLTEGQQAAGAALAAAATSAAQGFAGSAAAFVQGATGINQQSATGFKQLGTGNKRSATNLATDAEAGFRDATKNADGAYSEFGDKVEENFRAGRTQMMDGLWSQETQSKLNADMDKYGQEAADHVKPRWKRVLKWVITIVVIVAVIAVTVLTAGALGPVGVVLLGAALGAAAGAVTTIANNLIDGEPWSKGVVKAMIVGAVGGAVGGAGGVLLKGVGSVALRIGLEAGVNVIGGVAGEALGSVATGQSVDWTGALMGALIGAGIGAGLGIAGAIRGKIRVGGIGEPAAPPPPRPTIEPPPPAPAGRLRSALEATKILAPRPAPVMPEVNVGAGAAGEGAPAPQPAPQPRRLAGFGERGTTTEQPPSDTRNLIGFGDRGTVTETPPAPVEATPGAPPPPPPTRKLIGFGDRGTTTEQLPSDTRRLAGFGERGTVTETPPPQPPPAEATPGAQPRPSPPTTRKLIGFGDRGTTTEKPPSDTRSLIGFGDRGTVTEAPPAPAEATPGAQPATPQPRRLIGFGDRGTVSDAPASVQPAPTPQPAAAAAPPPPRPMIIEPTAPRAGVGGGVEPIRAGGGGGPEIRASAKPPGAGAPRGGQQVIEPPRPVVNKPLGPAPGEAAASSTTPTKAPGAEPPISPRPAEPVESPKVGAAVEPVAGTKPEGAQTVGQPAPKAVEPSGPPATTKAPAATAAPEPAPPGAAAKAQTVREVPPHVTGGQKARLSRLLKTAEDAGLHVGEEQLDEIGKRLGATRNAAQADEVVSFLEQQLEASIAVKGTFRGGARVPGGSRAGDLAAELPEGTQASGTTTKPRTAVLTDAEQLAADLSKHVEPRPPGHEAHHIVPKGMAEGEEAREILRDAGIGINDVENGVWLPADTEIANPVTSDIHSRVHTGRAIRIITEILREGAKDGPDGVRRALVSIRNNLSELRFER